MTNQFKIESIAVWMDGGSITINFIDLNGKQSEIEFVQHFTFNIIDKEEKLPCRIYLNNKLIQVRSSEEQKLITDLIKADTSKISKLDKQCLNEAIAYTKSDTYVSDSKKEVIIIKR